LPAKTLLHQIINFEFIDVETTEGASEFVMNANNGKESSQPFYSMRSLPNPDNATLTKLPISIK
jgi:thioredoxin reductase (NADPH)